MTDLLAPPRPVAVTAPRSLLVIGVFLIGGALWGAAARVWMRVVSAEPEFSWSGTLFIVGLFTVVGTAQGLALAVRRRDWRPWIQAPFRIVAGFAGLLLGAGAGIVMLPALVTGSLALARRGWPRVLRGVLGAIAVVDVVVMIPLLHADLGWVRTIVGWLLMLPLYAVIISAIALNLRPLSDRRPVLPEVRRHVWPFWWQRAVGA